MLCRCRDACSACFDYIVLVWSRSFVVCAESLVEEAREHVAALIGAESGEIVFTSGATESNNLAIKGVARFAAKGQKKKNHIITTLTVRALAPCFCAKANVAIFAHHRAQEHKCVLDSCRSLENDGFKVSYLPGSRIYMCSLSVSRFGAAEFTRAF